MKQETKRSLRTGLQTVLALALALPAIVAETGLDVAWPWLAAAVVVIAGVAGVLARVMAIPAVQRLLAWFGLGTDDTRPGGVDELARRDRG